MRHAILSLILLTQTAVFAQHKAEFLPQGHLFAPILLDALEAQTGGSLLKRWEEGQAQKGMFAPFVVGLKKPLVRWTRDEARASELALDMGVFTQFEMFTDNRGWYRRYLYNTDYKISLLYALRRRNHAWRFRFYHLSSHLGDDYILRNGIASPYPDANNYEQFDLLYSTQLGQTRLYGGAGFVLSAAAERKQPYFQAGTLYKSPGATARLVAGADLRLLAQTDYTPNLKVGLGLELGAEERRPLTLLAEFYTGKIPYSTYEERRTTWVGAGVYFNPF